MERAFQHLARGFLHYGQITTVYEKICNWSRIGVSSSKLMEEFWERDALGLTVAKELTTGLLYLWCIFLFQLAN